MSAVNTAESGPTVAAVGRLGAAWCAADTMVRRALVAAITTSLMAGAAAPVKGVARFGLALTGVILAAAALVDVHERKLPNRLLLWAAAATAFAPAASVDPSLAVRGLGGAVIAGGAVLLVRLTRGVGMGDVKAAAVVGASAGTIALVAAPVAVAVAASTAAAYGLLARRRRVPLGPSLWIGWATVVLVASTGWWS